MARSKKAAQAPKIEDRPEDESVFVCTAATVHFAVGDEVTGRQVREAGGSVEFLLASNHIKPQEG